MLDGVLMRVPGLVELAGAGAAELSRTYTVDVEVKCGRLMDTLVVAAAVEEVSVIGMTTKLVGDGNSETEADAVLVGTGVDPTLLEVELLDAGAAAALPAGA